MIISDTSDKLADKSIEARLTAAAEPAAENSKKMSTLLSLAQFFKPYNIVKELPEVDIEASFNAAEALLEYKIVQAIYLMNRTVKPSIAYLVGHGEPLDFTVNDLGQSIKNQYNLGVFDLKNGLLDDFVIGSHCD